MSVEEEYCASVEEPKDLLATSFDYTIEKNGIMVRIKPIMLKI